MSRFAYSHSFLDIAELLAKLRVVITSPQITQPVRRGTMKSRFLNPGPYTSPLDRSFPIERVDTIHAARTEQWTSPWETFRAVLTVQVSFRYATSLYLGTRTDVRRSGIERRVRNREEKESIRTFRNTCDASTVALSRASEIFGITPGIPLRYSLPVMQTHDLAVPKYLCSSSSSFAVPPKFSNHLSFLFSHALRNYKLSVRRDFYLGYSMIGLGKFLMPRADFTLEP